MPTTSRRNANEMLHPPSVVSMASSDAPDGTGVTPKKSLCSTLVPGCLVLLESVDWELVETFHCVISVGKNLEQPVDLCQFQDHRRPRRDCGQFQVSISFHRLFHAVQKHLDTGAVHLCNLRKIKYQTRSIRFQKFLNLTEERLSSSQHQLFRELQHYDGCFGSHRFSPGPSQVVGFPNPC